MNPNEGRYYQNLSAIKTLDTPEQVNEHIRDKSWENFMSDADRGYIAGFLDGEGSIIATAYLGNPGSVTVHVVWCNTNLEALQWIQSKVGGSIYTAQARKPRVSQGILRRETKRVSSLEIQNRPRIIAVLTDLLPLLKIKREQAIKAIELCKIKVIRWPIRAPNGRDILGTRNVTDPKLMERRVVLMHEIQSLNRGRTIP